MAAQMSVVWEADSVLVKIKGENIHQLHMQATWVSCRKHLWVGDSLLPCAPLRTGEREWDS